MCGDASPDDSSLREYWEKRHQKYGKTRFEKGSKLYLAAENQNWKCPVCGEPLFNRIFHNRSQSHPRHISGYLTIPFRSSDKSEKETCDKSSAVKERN